MQKPKEKIIAEVTCRKGLYHALAEWTKIVSGNLPKLSQPEARVLAMWSLGMVLAQASGLTAVTLYLAEVLSKKRKYSQAAVT